MLASLLLSLSYIIFLVLFSFPSTTFTNITPTLLWCYFPWSPYDAGGQQQRTGTRRIVQFIMSISLWNLHKHNGIHQESQITQLDSTGSFQMARKENKNKNLSSYQVTLNKLNLISSAPSVSVLLSCFLVLLEITNIFYNYLQLRSVSVEIICSPWWENIL